MDASDDKLYEHLDIPRELLELTYHTGSSAVCNPPVQDTDIDFVIYTKTQGALNEFLHGAGITLSTHDQEEYDLQQETFWCYRKDRINLIVTDNKEFYLKWVKATRLAKLLNLQEKEQRISLFKYFLYSSQEI